MKADKIDNKVIFRTDSVNAVYELGTELGRGQFAVVKRCKHKDDGIEFAAKCVRKKRTRASKIGLSRELIEREASILLELDHENIIKLFEVYETKEEVTLILELMVGGELFEEISEQEYLTEDDACHYTKQVLEAVSYLHEKDVVHLDIKPENIVLKEKGSKIIKLVDFGLAQKLFKGKEVKEMMGTPEFVAPEIINYDAIGPYSDMWAIGVMTYILLSGASPFLGDDMQETYQNIIAVDYDFDEEYFSSISDEAINFIRNLLVKKPSQRNTAKDCLSHPWILPQTHHNSLIKTTGFKAFLARRRWQQSFRKVCIVSRFRILGRNRASVDLSATEDMEKEEKPRSSSVINWLDLQQAAAASEHYRGRSSSKDVDIGGSHNKLVVPGQEQIIVLSSDQEERDGVSHNEKTKEGASVGRKITLVKTTSTCIGDGELASNNVIQTPKIVLDILPFEDNNKTKSTSFSTTSNESIGTDRGRPGDGEGSLIMASDQVHEEQASTRRGKLKRSDADAIDASDALSKEESDVLKEIMKGSFVSESIKVSQELVENASPVLGVTSESIQVDVGEESSRQNRESVLEGSNIDQSEVVVDSSVETGRKKVLISNEEIPPESIAEGKTEKRVESLGAMAPIEVETSPVKKESETMPESLGVASEHIQVDIGEKPSRQEREKVLEGSNIDQSESETMPGSLGESQLEASIGSTVKDIGETESITLPEIKPETSVEFSVSTGTEVDAKSTIPRSAAEMLSETGKESIEFRSVTKDADICAKSKSIEENKGVCTDSKRSPDLNGNMILVKDGKKQADRELKSGVNPVKSDEKVIFEKVKMHNKLQSSTITLDVRHETTFEVNRTVTVLASPFNRAAPSPPKESVRKIYRASTDVGIVHSRTKSSDEIKIEIDSKGKRTLTLPRSLSLRRTAIEGLVPIRYPSQPNLSPVNRKFVCKLYKETPV